MNLSYPPPAYCAACYGQYPERRHVDLGAAYDGGTFKDAGGTTLVVDDLIICERCLRSAAELIDMGDVEELEEQLKIRIDMLQKTDILLAEKDTVIRNLAKAVDLLLKEAGVPAPKKKVLPEEALYEAEKIVGSVTEDGE